MHTARAALGLLVLFAAVFIPLFVDRRSDLSGPMSALTGAYGPVNTIELRELVSAASDCAVEAGAPPIHTEWSWEGLVRSQSFGGFSSDEEREQLLEISDACWDEHVGAVELVLARHLAAEP